MSDELEQLVLDAAAAIRAAVRPGLGRSAGRARVGVAPGGDATLAIDEVAERVLEARVRDAGDLAFYSEDRGLVTVGRPRAILVVDPVDGTRPAAAGLEAACVSIALLPASQHATIGDVEVGVVHEIKDDRRFVARRGAGTRVEAGDGTPLPAGPAATTDLSGLFWSRSDRGRPVVPTAVVLEELVDGTAMGGGSFELGSATFGLTRLVTGQLDAYVDVGRRMLDEHPELEPAFRAVGEGSVCTNFPYDVAAAVLVVAEAGGVVTHADGRALDDHPAVGSGDGYGLAVVGAASPALHELVLASVDRGIVRLGRWLAGPGRSWRAGSDLGVRSRRSEPGAGSAHL